MRRRSTASVSAQRPRLAGDRMSFISNDSGFSGLYEEDELWEEDEDMYDAARASPPQQRKEEPMSPVAVVLYVVFFYIVWQILTRSDDTEILSHLPSGSPLLSPHALERSSSLPPPQPQQHPYLPYPLPQLPSPIQAAGGSESSSTWRVVLGTIVYPIYLAIALIAIPLPYLVNAVNLILSILSTILYPVTSTSRLLAKTFVIAPLNVVYGLISALYPVYVFVGGVVGVGCFMGMGAGWIGQLGLGWILRPKQLPRRRKSRRVKSPRSGHPTLSQDEQAAPSLTRHSSLHRSGSVSFERPILEQRASSFEHRASATFERPVISRPTSGTFERPILSRPVSGSYTAPGSRPLSGSYERRYVPIVDVLQIGDDLVAVDNHGHGTAREAVVLGLRRRGVRV
ncbi:hypothetical protein Q8F55_007132 [Vanrija albida]|uniref:Protein YIP n=1 Tax=Vanrija albida TaxID=181172 RepID=A0ABR3PZ32_9TREE